MTTKQKILSIDPRSNGINHSPEKEMVQTHNLVAYYKGRQTDLVTVRCYMGRSSSAAIVYATVWIASAGADAPQVHKQRLPVGTSGSGKAGGGGYHKVSAAVNAAFADAGADVAVRFNGAGDSAVEDALEAVAKHLGYKKTTIVKNS